MQKNSAGIPVFRYPAGYCHSGPTGVIAQHATDAGTGQRPFITLEYHWSITGATLENHTRTSIKKKRAAGRAKRGRPPSAERSEAATPRLVRCQPLEMFRAETRCSHRGEARKCPRQTQNIRILQLLLAVYAIHIMLHRGARSPLFNIISDWIVQEEDIRNDMQDGTRPRGTAKRAGYRGGGRGWWRGEYQGCD